MSCRQWTDEGERTDEGEPPQEDTRMTRKRTAVTRQEAVAAIIDDWRRERPELDTSPLEVFARLHRTFLRYQSQVSKPLERCASTGWSRTG